MASARKSSIPGLGGDRCGGQWVVAGDHYRADAHPPKLGETLAHAGLENVLELEHAEQAPVVGNCERRAPGTGDFLCERLQLHELGRMESSPVAFRIEVDRSFLDQCVLGSTARRDGSGP